MLAASAPYEQTVLVVGGAFTVAGLVATLAGLLGFEEKYSLVTAGVVMLGIGALAGYYGTDYHTGEQFVWAALFAVIGVLWLRVVRSRVTRRRRGRPVAVEEVDVQHEREAAEHDHRERDADPGVGSGEVGEHPSTVDPRTKRYLALAGGLAAVVGVARLWSLVKAALTRRGR